ncbi:MAG: NUDIX domain-containing protein [Candidatus Portnoybacteria bacterium]|nr:NUDIX domain-containing protein [Candidatus Portnoybacteria bacterium]
MKKEKKPEVIGAICFLLSKDGKILLQLRDDNKEIPYPDQWNLIGGACFDGEDPDDAIIREIKEEIGFEPNDISKILINYSPGGVERHWYVASFFEDINSIDLKEGQEIRLFSLEEMEEMDLAFWCNEVIPILKRYLDSQKGEGRAKEIDCINKLKELNLKDNL